MQTFQDIAGRFACYFECTVHGAVLHLKRRQNAIAQAGSPFGKMILFSSKAAAWDGVLPLYRQRDAAEKQIDQLKNGLDLLPLRIQNTFSLRELLFIFFMALLLRVHLLK
jgi:transposase